WVKFVCTALDIAMMVWAARARCFVAGTPVVIGLVLEGPPPNEDGGLLPASLSDRIGGLALLVGLAALATHQAQRPNSRKARRQVRTLGRSLSNGRDPLPDPDGQEPELEDEPSGCRDPLTGLAQQSTKAAPDDRAGPIGLTRSFPA